MSRFNLSVIGWTARSLLRKRSEVKATRNVNTATNSLQLRAGRSTPSFRKLKNDGVELCFVSMAGLERDGQKAEMNRCDEKKEREAGLYTRSEGVKKLHRPVTTKSLS